MSPAGLLMQLLSGFICFQLTTSTCLSKSLLPSRCNEAFCFHMRFVSFLPLFSHLFRSFYVLQKSCNMSSDIVRRTSIFRTAKLPFFKISHTDFALVEKQI